MSLSERLLFEHIQKHIEGGFELDMCGEEVCINPRCYYGDCRDEFTGRNLSAKETINLLNALNGENESLRDYLQYIDKCYYEKNGEHIRNAGWLK